MFSECANPACRTQFNYLEGHIFRFHKTQLPGELPPNTHSVQHFWLCRNCSRHLTLIYEDGRGVVLCRRPDLPGQTEQCCLVAVAWS